LVLGSKFRILTVVDISSRFAPIIDPRFSYRGADVVMALEKVCGEVRYTKTIRVDQVSEFVSRDLDLWACANNIFRDFSRPGKPTHNTFSEAFNSKVRSECLNAHWFMSLADVRWKLEDWCRYCNVERPHSVIGKMTPILLPNPDGASRLPKGSQAENSGLR
jgi:putative transposase